MTSVSIEHTGGADSGCGGASIDYGFLIHVTVSRPVTTIWYEVTVHPEGGDSQVVYSGQILRSPGAATAEFTIAYTFTNLDVDQPYFQIEARVWVPDVTDSGNSGSAPGPVENPCL